MKYLFLDDSRIPGDLKSEFYCNNQWDIVRNYDEFVSYINRNGIDGLFISFDHDLGFTNEYYIENNLESPDNEKSGYDCVKWLCTYCMDNNLRFPEYKIHSMNPTGAKNMECYIINFKKFTV